MTRASSTTRRCSDGLATDDEYDPSLLSRDLERIERYYRARGYYEAKVTAARVLQLDGKHVKLEIRVAPGVPVTVRRVDLPGVANLPPLVTKEVLRARTLKIGDAFDEGALRRDEGGDRGSPARSRLSVRQGRRQGTRRPD